MRDELETEEEVKPHDYSLPNSKFKQRLNVAMRALRGWPIIAFISIEATAKNELKVHLPVEDKTKDPSYLTVIGINGNCMTLIPTDESDRRRFLENNVLVGQIYRDNDPRVNRVVMVKEVVPRKGAPYARIRNVETGKETWILTKSLLVAGHRGFTYEGMTK